MDLRTPEFERPDARDGRATLAVVALVALLFGLLGILGVPTAAGSSEAPTDTCADGGEGDAVDLPSGDTSTFCYTDEPAPTTTEPAPATTEPAPPTTEPDGPAAEDPPPVSEVPAEPTGEPTPDEGTGPEGVVSSISMVKTVGVDGTTCATTDVVTVAANTQVFYCYQVTNTGPITLSQHDLVDDRLGTLLTNFPFGLAPGASAFLTSAATITQTTVNTATWTAYNAGPSSQASDSDTAQVVVVPPSITLEKTVGLDSSTCATTDVVTVAANTQVFYCYQVTNTGPITLSQHDLVDDRLGTLLTNFPFGLAPGASAFLTSAATITQTTVNTATWTAYNAGPSSQASDSDTAQVVVVPPSITLEKTVGLDPDVCATTDAIAVDAGTEVTYCYEVTNTGSITFNTHDLFDDQLGTLLTNFPFTLAPGASAFLTETTTIDDTTVNTATWTAQVGPPPSSPPPEGAPIQASDADSATVTVEGEPPPPTTEPPPTTAPPDVDPDVIDPDTDPGGTLARTGSDVNRWVVFGAGLIGFGLVLELVSRRRRSA